MRFRNFVFTSYKILDESERSALFANPDIRYIIYQHERCPTTNREHLQGYCELSRQLSIPTLRTIFGISVRGGESSTSGPSFHVEKRMGTQEQAIQYASKSDTRLHGPYEHGVRATPGARTDIVTAMHRLRNGESFASMLTDDSMVPVLVRHHNFFEKMINFTNNEPRAEKTKVIWVYGPTGTGKSHMAQQAGAAFLRISKSGFILGYSHQEVVCFDDVDSDTFTRQQWLTLTDKYPCTIDMKNMSGVQWNPKTMYVTSNFSPQDVFPRDAASLRRIDECVFLEFPYSDEV